MNPEQLKQIAEVMGYKFVAVVLDGVMYDWDIGFDCAREYNPKENAGQLLEIIEKLIHLHNLVIQGGFSGTDTTITNKNGKVISSGKTLADAVLSAMIEVIGGG